MEKKKSVNAALWRGFLWVNGPVILWITGIPGLTGYLSSRYLPGNVAVYATVAALFLGFAAAWTWWSFLIVVWRRWAFTHVAPQYWPQLKRRAIESNLIWPDGSRYEKTEFRKEADEVFFQQVDAAVRRQLRQQQSGTLPVDDDGTVPDELVFYYHRREIIVGLFYVVFIIGVGIYFLGKGDYFIGSLVLLSSLLALDRGSIQKLRDRSPQLTLNDRGITMKITEPEFTAWSDTRNMMVEPASGTLTLDLWRNETWHKTIFPLKGLGIKDYDDFLLTMQIFIQRYRTLESGR